MTCSSIKLKARLVLLPWAFAD